MRQLVVDQLSLEERLNLESYLKRKLRPGQMDGVFWLELPHSLWGEAQRGHDLCAPFFFGVELEESRVVFELLIRSSSNLHCSCISYPEPAQREFVLAFFDEMLAGEHIRA